ncbi:MFS transporter [Micromonospora sp. NPDC000316]|uniref:MFS transporter n=1 Tax=Micromonospora sp. NPDC000316 TaxID=3364216 RepID=UPI0036C9E624
MGRGAAGLRHGRLLRTQARTYRWTTGRLTHHETRSAVPRIIPPAGPPRVLALAQLANSLGDGAFYACSALFFIRVVGLSPTQIGIALTVGWSAGILAGVPAGQLADRHGPRRMATIFAVGTAGALSVFLVVRSFPLFVLLTCGYACCQAGLTASRQALLAGLVEPERRMTVRAHLQATLNAGLAVGAGLGALALLVDTVPAYLAVFVLDAVSFLAAAAVVRRLPEVAPTDAARPAQRRLAVLRDRPYALIMILNAVMYLNMPLLSLALPLWIAERTDAPTSMSAVLLAVNMTCVVLLQVRVARRVTDPRTAGRASGHAGWVLLVACAGYAVSPMVDGAWAASAVLLAAAAVQVLGEMVQASSSWELGFALAPPDRQGQYQGFFGMAPQIARMLGPVLLTTLLMGLGTIGWLMLGGLFLAAGLAMGPAVRLAGHGRPRHRQRAIYKLVGEESL